MLLARWRRASRGDTVDSLAELVVEELVESDSELLERSERGEVLSTSWGVAEELVLEDEVAEDEKEPALALGW